MTKSDLAFPAMMHGEYWLELYINASSLANDKRTLAWLNDDICRNKIHLSFVDSSFRQVSVSQFNPVQGVGLLYGYYFEGPFLKRRMMYEADVTYNGIISKSSVADIILAFLRKGEGVARSEIIKRQDSFWERNA